MFEFVLNKNHVVKFNQLRAKNELWVFEASELRINIQKMQDSWDEYFSVDLSDFGEEEKQLRSRAILNSDWTADLASTGYAAFLR